MEMFEVFAFRADKHVTHEESMVGTSTNDSDLNSVFLVPASKSIDNIDAVPGVQVINGTFSVDSPNLNEKTQISKWSYPAAPVLGAGT
jgi:hypothetical protein